MSPPRLHPLTAIEQTAYIRRLTAAGYLLIARAGRQGIGLVWPNPPPPRPGACELRTIALEQIQAAQAAGWIVPCTATIGSDLLGPQTVPAWRARGPR